MGHLRGESFEVCCRCPIWFRLFGIWDLFHAVPDVSCFIVRRAFAWNFRHLVWNAVLRVLHDSLA